MAPIPSMFLSMRTACPCPTFCRAQPFACERRLIFDQRLLHSGLAVQRGTKHIAQVGLLRGAPSAISGAPSTFRFGPGLDVR